MNWVYNSALAIFWLLAKVAAIFNVKAKQFVTGRKTTFYNLSSAFSDSDNVIWFHCASLGEFEQGRPVIEAIKEQNPHIKVLLTFFSPSGYEVRKNYSGADFICYLPIDFSWNATHFLDVVKPLEIYFIKYEFWHNYISEAYKRNIPVYCFSANFRKNQLFFKWYGVWYLEVLKKFNHLFVQNENSRLLLEKVGITHVTVAGDTRFDRVHQIAMATKELPVIEAFSAKKRVVVAGSTWPADEQLLVSYINQCQFDIKFVIAPHELNETNIEQLQNQITQKTIRYSKVTNAELADYKVLIIDNIGMLSSIYKYGVVAYIGGGFGKSIHNILEAATFGLPVLIGPEYHKFQEAIDLVQRGGVFPIYNAEELKHTFNAFLTNSENLEKASNICKNFVIENTGATAKILNVTSRQFV